MVSLAHDCHYTGNFHHVLMNERIALLHSFSLKRSENVGREILGKSQRVKLHA